MLSEAAFEVVQLSVLELPLLMLVGLAENVIVGAGAFTVTTAVCAIDWPFVPTAVAV